MSKRSEAVAVMKANSTKSMAEVVALIVKAIDVTEANAKSYYRYIVKHNLAPGSVEKAAKAPKTPKVKVAKEPKVVAAGRAKANKAIAKVVSKGDAKLAEIRKQNLERMREVAARRKEPVAVDVSDEAMAGFEMPKFLTKGQLKELL